MSDDNQKYGNRQLVHFTIVVDQNLETKLWRARSFLPMRDATDSEVLIHDGSCLNSTADAAVDAGLKCASNLISYALSDIEWSGDGSEDHVREAMEAWLVKSQQKWLEKP